MKKTKESEFQILTRIESERIVAGIGGKNDPPPKSGGSTNGGTVSNELCAIYALNPPAPGTPEYADYMVCLYGPPSPGNNPGFSPLP